MDMTVWRDLALALFIALVGSGGALAYIRLKPDVNKIRAETNKIVIDAQKVAHDIVTETAQQAAEANQAAADVTKAAAQAWKILLDTQGETITGLQARLKEKITQIDALQKELNEARQQLFDCMQKNSQVHL